MKHALKAIASAVALMTLSAIPAVADSLFDVEHARAIARSGGPVSEYDAELLERWGALSGTPEYRGRTRETFEYYWDDQPRRVRKTRRNYDR